MKLEKIIVKPLMCPEQEALVCIDPLNIDQVVKALRLNLQSDSDMFRALRGMLDSKTGEIFLCCGGDGIHVWVARGLGVDPKACFTIEACYKPSKQKWIVLTGMGESVPDGVFEEPLDKIYTLFGYKDYDDYIAQETKEDREDYWNF